MRLQVMTALVTVYSKNRVRSQANQTCAVGPELSFLLTEGLVWPHPVRTSNRRASSRWVTPPLLQVINDTSTGLYQTDRGRTRSGFGAPPSGVDGEAEAHDAVSCRSSSSNL